MFRVLKSPICFALMLGCISASPASANKDELLSATRGVVRAQTHSTLSSEIVARIVEIPFKAGQHFRVGDTLLKFDCARYEAELRAARANARIQEITAKEKRQLHKRRAAGINELAVAEAQLEQALASVEALEVTISQCTISAPFDGRVAERKVDLFELPQANSPLINIVSDGDLEVELIVPSDWMVWLRPGQEFQFKVDETATIHATRLTNVGAVVDPISRTIRVTGQLLDPSDQVRPGMSGQATMRLPSG